MEDTTFTIKTTITTQVDISGEEPVVTHLLDIDSPLHEEDVDLTAGLVMNGLLKSLDAIDNGEIDKTLKGE